MNKPNVCEKRTSNNDGTRNRKAIPAKYSVGKHSIKRRINQWILSKYINARKSSSSKSIQNPSWAFVLESSACLTLETLLESKESGILESSIVVPNPDVGVLNDIKNKYPSVNLFKSTSHDFLKTCPR